MDYSKALEQALLESRIPDTAWGRLNSMLKRNSGKTQEEIISEWFGNKPLNEFQTHLVSLLMGKTTGVGGRKNALNAANEIDDFEQIDWR